MNLKKQILYGAILFGFALGKAFAGQFYMEASDDLLQAAPSVTYKICDNKTGICSKDMPAVTLTKRPTKIHIDDGKYERIDTVTFSPKGNASPKTIKLNYGGSPNWVYHFSYLSDVHTNIEATYGIAGKKSAN